MEKCYRIALWASWKKWTNRNVNCNSLLRCQERGKSTWGCCTLTRYLVEVKNSFFFFLPWSELSTSGKEKETQISWAKIGNKNANSPLVNSHETGIHVGGKAWVFPAVFTVAGKSSLPLCLGDGRKQGDHAWPALLRRECSTLEGMQVGLGWDQGMENFTTQTLWTSADWGIRDYILKWLSFEGSKYGQRGPWKPLVPDSLLSLSWELSPALLPSMWLRLEVGKDALYTARGRGNPWPHDFMQMVLGFSHNPLLLFLGRDLTSPLPECKHV